MKQTKLAVLPAALLMTALNLSAALNIPSDGSDGAFTPTDNVVVDLSQALTGNWDTPMTGEDVGKGIYDPAKWAVVFKYSSVNIPAGKTVTFKNHPSRAPVVWLVSGDVTVSGTIDLNGQSWQAAPRFSEPGPGGFRGGQGWFSSGVGSAAGLGVGGGGIQSNAGYGGSYGSVGGNGSSAYGNPSLLPLIGGSGGGGDGDNFSGGSAGGAAGGGAILIASTQTISVTGTLRANGGSGRNDSSRETGGGSGGGIRLVATTLAGNGIIQALGGGGWQSGGLGRIRLERASNTGTMQVNPDPSVVPLQDGGTPLIWLPSDGPRVRVISIGSATPPNDPRASFGADGADVTLPQTSTTPILVETTNAENASVVKVRVAPRTSGNFTETTASLTQVVSTDPLVIRWTANIPVNPGYSAVQVKVVRP